MIRPRSQPAWGVTAIVLLLPAAGLAGGDPSPSPLDWVDPFIGADGGGETVPGAAVPFGFVELSPDTAHGGTNGYASGEPIMGFSLTHVSGTGGNSKYGNFRVTPLSGALEAGNLRFPASQESASPGFYAVTLRGARGAIRCEVAAARLAGIERFTFPAGPDGALLLEATSHVLLDQHATHAAISQLDPTHVAGQASFVGGWNPAPYTLYFYGELSRPARKFGVWSASMGSQSLSAGLAQIEGSQNNDYLHRLGAFAVFGTAKGRVVLLKLAVSFVSVAKARQNLEQEIPDWDFAAVQARARDQWRQVLDRIRVEGGTNAQKRNFYSALFRSHYMPHDLTGENVWWSSSEPHYEDFYTLWDTFRTLHPLLTLIEPERQRAMVRSLLDTYRHTGWLPDARIGGANGLTQGGSNGDVLVADAVVKNLGGFDLRTAYAAVLKDAAVTSAQPMIQGRELDEYSRLGYLSLNESRSASRTLEYAYDDFCVSEVAHQVGNQAAADLYRRRSLDWTNLWDPGSLSIRPRYADGRWLENFNADTNYPDTSTAHWWDVPFYEGSAIQYSTFVPHDVAGLIARTGGDAGFTRWLDRLFDAQLYDPTNEQDLLAPYLYIHAGRQDRTVDRVRELLKTVYHDDRRGLPGNDDSGTMSSWYVWSALGLFPNAGQPYYYIGSPLFRRVVLSVGNGRTFIIEAPGTSDSCRYVQSAELNGAPLNRAWLWHAEVANGGRLILHLGPKPAAWGSGQPPNPMAQVEGLVEIQRPRTSS